MPATAAAALVAELEAEAHATRRLLDRVPADRLAWQPHPKSMTLGALALHVATIPGNICNLAALEEFDASAANFTSPEPADRDEIARSLDEALAKATAYLAPLEDETLAATWQLSNRGQRVFAVPRAGMLRSLLFNHWYHHRGQLSVYLRLLDVPLPVTYGRTADENPFGA